LSEFSLLYDAGKIAFCSAGYGTAELIMRLASAYDSVCSSVNLPEVITAGHRDCNLARKDTPDRNPKTIVHSDLAKPTERRGSGARAWSRKLIKEMF